MDLVSYQLLCINRPTNQTSIFQTTFSVC